MWYSSGNSFYCLANEFDHTYERYFRMRYASPINLESVKLLLTGIKLATYFMSKINPLYMAPINAIERYINGSGDDFVLPAEYFRELGEYIFNRAISERSSLLPREVVSFLFDYGDYNDALKKNVDRFTGKENAHRFNPLRWIIGGWTANVWYDIDSNNIVHVYLKMEDKYDWDNGPTTSYDLESLGAMKNPIIKNVLRKIDAMHIDGIFINDKSLTIEDSFWRSLEDNNLAKSYTNKFEGEIYVLSSSASAKFLSHEDKKMVIDTDNHKNAFEIMLARADRGVFSTYDMLKITPEKQFQLIEAYYNSKVFGSYVDDLERIMYKIMFNDNLLDYIKENKKAQSIIMKWISADKDFSIHILEYLCKISYSMALYYLQKWIKGAPLVLLDSIGMIKSILMQASWNVDQIQNIINFILKKNTLENVYELGGDTLIDNYFILNELVPYHPDVVSYMSGKFQLEHIDLVRKALLLNPFVRSYVVPEAFKEE